MMDAVDSNSLDLFQLEFFAEVRYRKNTICFVELYFKMSTQEITETT